MNTSTAVKILACSLFFVISSSVSQPTYYPLAVGNVWQFGDAQHQTKTISDTLLPDGHRYGVLLDTWYNLREHQRQQGDSIFLPNLLLYDFSRLPGDTIAASPNGYVCVLISTNIVQVLGRQLRQWVFARSWGSFTGEVDYVTDSLGVTAILNLEPPSQKVLTGARIDGITYGVVASVKNIIPLGVPGGIVLWQNYPNPFNPTTVIRFGLSTKSLVKLAIYNMIGQQVAVVVDEIMEPGEYEVPFSAQNLASGVYLYRLKTGEMLETKQMIVLK